MFQTVRRIGTGILAVKMEVGSRRWKDQSNTSERRDRSAGSVVEAVVEVEDIANLQLVTVATGIPLLSWIYRAFYKKPAKARRGTLEGSHFNLVDFVKENSTVPNAVLYRNFFLSVGSPRLDLDHPF